MKSKLLNQQSSSSKILIEDTNKESSSKQEDIDGLYRSITRKVFGRDKERDRICRMLRDGPNPYGPSSRSSKRYSVIGIHGIAGSGKSILAQYVCDYEKDEGNHFDLVMFIHVSTSFRLGDIFRDMLEQMKQNRPSNDRGLNSLQEELKEKLKGRCFLLVLDNVWVNDGNSKERAILLHVLDSGKSGSGILVTAQKRDAARALGAQKLIAISDLEEEQYFSMFMHHVALQGTGSIDDREHIVIGRKIMKKLHKSPIAAVTVAARLGMKPDINFWETTANLDVLNKTMGALWWSYQQLGADIRRCFEYCSTFPRGYRLGRDEVVRIWIAQGFVDTSSAAEDMEDLGHRYFDELLTFSFVQVQRTIIDTEQFTIHDLLHELAERVAGGDFFRMDVNCSPKDIPHEVRHLFIETNNRAEVTEKILDLGNLRTLVIVECDTNMDKITMALWNDKENHDLVKEKVFAKIFMRLRKLRVLIIKIEHYDKLVFSVPASIGQMKHLRYLSFLSISHVELIFPSKFRKLYHMQVLEVNAFKLSHDEDMANLIHLRYISARQNLANIHKLSSLNTIRCFRVRKEQGYGLNQLMHLNNLRGSLDINGLENVESKEEALQARLAQKKGIKALELKFAMHSSNPDVEVEVLEGLCPPEHLEQLSIWFYSCSRYPSRMLSRHNPDTPKHLYRLGLYRCSKLVSIPENSDFFINLRKLHLSWCSWDALPHNMELLTSLEELCIYECNEIKLLPVLPRSLEHVTITGNYMLRTSCQERGHINWQKVHHIPIQRFS
ncbi:unnamed protein product [Urochloa decumbens]|uniref:NB-ARC domain-containing protein n=1 Tax=Urochloa decumbens TaxID=240449 RepID=A0ABC9B4Y7_9POAL